MKKEKVIQPNSITALELVDLVPSSKLKALSLELQVDKHVSKLTGSVMFKLIFCSILDNERLSLRVMESTLDSQIFKLLGVDSPGSIAHSAIQQRLIKIEAKFFKSIHTYLYKKLRKKYSVKQLEGYHIKRYDSTMVATFSHLLKGMKVGNTSKNKTQAKFTTELEDDFLIRVRFHTDQPHLSEETALREAIQLGSHSLEDLVVFDRGLKSRKTFVSFDENNTNFVTRLTDNPKFETVSEHSSVIGLETDKLVFVKDSVVRLFGDAGTLVNHEFRLIETVSKKTNQKIFFLTNIKDEPAEFITKVYLHRWDIEVLFRFLKQEMNLTHFVCNDSNAIEVMIYMTLIASMLVLAYKNHNGIKSYKIAKIQFFKELLADSIVELLEMPDGKELVKKLLQKHVRT